MNYGSSRAPPPPASPSISLASPASGCAGTALSPCYCGHFRCVECMMIIIEKNTTHTHTRVCMIIRIIKYIQHTHIHACVIVCISLNVHVYVNSLYEYRLYLFLLSQFAPRRARGLKSQKAKKAARERSLSQRYHISPGNLRKKSTHGSEPPFQSLQKIKQPNPRCFRV